MNGHTARGGQIVALAVICADIDSALVCGDGAGVVVRGGTGSLVTADGQVEALSLGHARSFLVSTTSLHPSASTGQWAAKVADRLDELVRACCNLGGVDVGVDVDVGVAVFSTPSNTRVRLNQNIQLSMVDTPPPRTR